MRHFNWLSNIDWTLQKRNCKFHACVCTVCDIFILSICVYLFAHKFIPSRFSKSSAQSVMSYQQNKCTTFVRRPEIKWHLQYAKYLTFVVVKLLLNYCNSFFFLKKNKANEKTNNFQTNLLHLWIEERSKNKIVSHISIYIFTMLIIKQIWSF